MGVTKGDFLIAHVHVRRIKGPLKVDRVVPLVSSIIPKKEPMSINFYRKYSL